MVHTQNRIRTEAGPWEWSNEETQQSRGRRWKVRCDEMDCELWHGLNYKCGNTWREEVWG